MKYMIKREQKFYDKHKAEYLKKYLGKVVVIHKNELKGVFDTDDEAINYTIEQHFPRNTFMIQRVSEKEETMQMIQAVF